MSKLTRIELEALLTSRESFVPATVGAVRGYLDAIEAERDAAMARAEKAEEELARMRVTQKDLDVLRDMLSNAREAPSVVALIERTVTAEAEAARYRAALESIAAEGDDDDPWYAVGQRAVNVARAALAGTGEKT